MSKQDPFRFNLRFDEEDEDHRKVCVFLNACGRKKARYIVKAFQAYWAANGGELRQAEQETDICLKKNADNGETEKGRGEESQAEKQESHMVSVEMAGYATDDAEVSLMRKNYQMFDSLGEEM